MRIAAAVEYYFQRYGDLDLQRRMVGDRRRTDTFARALREAVGEGDTVLDVGTGTGVLAMLAAKAGASKVWAIDQAEIAKTAANLVKANNLADRVKVLRGPASELRLDEPVDLLVSEWLGHFAFVESMLDDVLVARDHNLKPGGRMMPSNVSLHLAPVDDPVLYGHDGPGFWREPVCGLDFSSLEAVELQQGRALQIRVEPAALMAKDARLMDLDLVTAKNEAPFQQGEANFEIRRDGVLSGFVGWFVAQLSPSVALDTGPFHPETHWSQSYFCFAPRIMRRGEQLSVKWSLDRNPDEHRHVMLHLEIDGHQQRYSLE